MSNLDLPNHKLAVYLIKSDYKNFNDILKVKTGFKRFNFNSKIEDKGLVVVGDTKNSQPSWSNLLQEGVEGKLPLLENTSNRAVLFFEINNRIFAIPFGYGKHLLKDEAIDREFGLKTVLNIVNADKLISIDKANIGDLSVHTKTQASTKGTPDLFNVDVIKDLLRSVTGEPTTMIPDEYGNIITGNEAVYISPKTNILKIPKILRKLEEDYRKDLYKIRFDWIDNIKVEKDPEIIEQLKTKLIIDLKRKNNSSLHLAPPFIISWEDFEYITFTPQGEKFTEFEIDNFYSEKNEIIDDADWEKLIKRKIYIKFSNFEDVVSYPFWRFLNYQTEHIGSNYVFTLSNWYKVDSTYYQELINYCNKIAESKSIFINCEEGDNEGQYNEKLANSNKAFKLFDKDLVKSEISRSSIEVCDILNLDEKEFIHVKFRDSSSTLSHLFAQGRVSSNSLRRDEIFRKNLRNKLGLNRTLIPIKNKDFNPGDYTITFAIIEKKQRTFVESLPFFSLVNFRMSAEDLMMMGFKVNVKKIIEQ